MTLKWVGGGMALVTASAWMTAYVTVDVIADRQVPIVLHIIATAVLSVSTVLVIVGELYGRLDSRLDAISDFLVNRLEEIDTRIGDRNSGFVEGYLTGQDGTPSVTPLSPRRSRQRAVPDSGD